MGVCLNSCVSYPACKSNLFCAALCSHLTYYIFPRYFINGTIFEKKKFIGHKMCVLVICIICV